MVKVDSLLESLRSALFEGIKKSIKNGELSCDINNSISANNILIDVPANKINGDFSTNIAMMSAKIFKMSPKKIAENILKNSSFDDLFVERYEVAGPGFINFFLNNEFYKQVLLNIFEKDENYGKLNIGFRQRVLVEYVSANPTGPMHMGNARGGAFGDCLASLLNNAGYDVKREFYINDAGNQILKFALSLDIRYQQLINKSSSNPALPDDCYQGADIIDLAKEFYGAYKDKYINEPERIRQKALVDFALPKNIDRMRADLERYNIYFDTWFSEKSLYDSKEVEETINEFKNKNLTYEKDGALWFRASSFGSEKDEVLVRNNGVPTYYLVDIAYHRNKFLKRNFDLCIDLWGADHAGHVERMHTALKSLGLDDSKLKIILFQLVRLVKDGKVIKMSKRTGKSINLRDLLDEIPVDAARFLFNMKNANSQMDFDLGLAVEKNMENPVYYVKYAHARICSVLKKIGLNYRNVEDFNNSSSDIIKKAEEKDLIKLLFFYPEEVTLACKEYDPSRIIKFLINVCAAFHKFYNSCRIVSEDESCTRFRALVCLCTKIVIRNILNLFKIDAPESM